MSGALGLKVNKFEVEHFMQKMSFPNQFLLHPKFKEKILSIQKDVNFPQIPISTNITKDDYFAFGDSKLLKMKEPDIISLNEYRGSELVDKYRIFGYDESIDKFQALEGAGYLTCHSLIMMDEEDYLASTCLSFNFYTRSELLLEKNSSIRDARNYCNYNSDSYNSDSMDENNNIDAAFKADYASDRSKFILTNISENSILYIDGPLIGKQMSAYTIELNKDLLKRSIIPIFVVKNSSSNLVTDNIQELKGKFNSDMHWAHKCLKRGQRTNFFQYKDLYNSNNSKVFCYIKPFNASPQRIEVHPTTYYGNENLIYQMLDLIYFLYLAQDELTNSQIRPIAIAEKFARETKKLFNINKILIESKLQPTMNQARGFR